MVSGEIIMSACGSHGNLTNLYLLNGILLLLNVGRLIIFMNNFDHF